MMTSYKVYESLRDFGDELFSGFGFTSGRMSLKCQPVNKGDPCSLLENQVELLRVATSREACLSS